MAPDPYLLLLSPLPVCRRRSEVLRLVLVRVGSRVRRGVVQHRLERLDVEDGVSQDLHLGQALVRNRRRLLPEDLESLVNLDLAVIASTF